MSLVLKNPHSVLAALKTRPQDVIDIRLPAGKPSPAWAEVMASAREHNIAIRTNLAEEPPPRQDRPQIGTHRSGSGDGARAAGDLD